MDVSRGQARVRLSVDGVYDVAHRLAWLHFYGGWPSGEVDHIDGNATRNAISNLRIARSRSAQMHNYKISSTNTSGYKGVKRHASKWVDKDGVTRSRMHFRADITLNRQKIFLGLYDTAEEAGRVYAEAALKYHGEYARLVMLFLRAAQRKWLYLQGDECAKALSVLLGCTVIQTVANTGRNYG